MLDRDLRLPWPTLIKVAIFAALVFAFLKLWPMILLFSLAVLVAVAADPPLRRLEKYLPRWLSVAIFAVVIAAVILIGGYLVLPPVVDQASHILERLPGWLDRELARLPEHNILRTTGSKLLQQNHFQRSDVEAWMPRLLLAGQVAFGGLSAALLVYVFTFYLLVDGSTAFRWLLHFFPAHTRERVEDTAEDMVPVVSAYMVGQLITSVAAGLFVFGLLSVLKVPAALTVGVIVALLDVLPVVGFFCGAVPAVLFAATVSPSTAVIVFVAFGAYHLFEAYVLSPWVYGRAMEISGLGVLLSLIVGAELGGIVGAIVIMPLAASFPILEKHWGKKRRATTHGSIVSSARSSL